MQELVIRGRQARLVLMAAAAIGCTIATLSGALAAFSYSAHAAGQARPPGNP